MKQTTFCPHSPFVTNGRNSPSWKSAAFSRRNRIAFCTKNKLMHPSRQCSSKLPMRPAASVVSSRASCSSSAMRRLKSTGARLSGSTSRRSQSSEPWKNQPLPATQSSAASGQGCSPFRNKQSRSEMAENHPRNPPRQEREFAQQIVVAPSHAVDWDASTEYEPSLPAWPSQDRLANVPPVFRTTRAPAARPLAESGTENIPHFDPASLARPPLLYALRSVLPTTPGGAAKPPASRKAR